LSACFRWTKEVGEDIHGVAAPHLRQTATKPATLPSAGCNRAIRPMQHNASLLAFHVGFPTTFKCRCRIAVSSCLKRALYQAIYLDGKSFVLGARPMDPARNGLEPFECVSSLKVFVLSLCASL
jgi:hypothetical protein